MTTQQQPWQSDTTSFADGDAFNHLSDPWPHHKAAAEPKQNPGFLTATPAAPGLYGKMSCKSPENHSPITSFPTTLQHGGQIQVCSTTGTRLLLLPLLPLTPLNCCSPCPLHRASSHISCSCSSSPNPPLEAALAQCTVTMLIQICLTNSPAAPGWGSVEGPLWPHCCSVPLLLLFLSFISLLFLLLSSLFWYEIPLTAPCKVSTAPSSVPEGSCTAWAEPHWLQQCPAANSIAYLHCKHNYLITKETGAAITEPLLDLLFWSISWCWNYKSWCKLVV